MHSLRYLFSAVTLGALACYTQAATVTTVASGSLRDLVTSPYTETALAVTGPIDGNDLIWIGRTMIALQDLNLSGAQIVATEGDRLNSRPAHPAGRIPDMALALPALQTVKFPANESLSIGKAAFAGSSLKSMDLSDGVQSVGDGAFAGCQLLETLTLPEGLEMGSSVFADCPRLTAVTFNGPITLGEGAFARCDQLSTLNGSTNITSIGSGAFMNCSALQRFTFSRQLHNVDDAAFLGSGLGVAHMTSCTGLESIGDWAFANCKALTSVSLPSTISRWGEGLFFDDNALESLHVPDGLNEIPDYALTGNEKTFTELSLPEGLTSIGLYAFKGNKSLRDVKLPSTLGQIGTGAMEGDTGLEAIDATALGSVPALGQDVWRGVEQAQVRLRVLDLMHQDFADAPQWQDFSMDPVTGKEDIMVEDLTRPVRAAFSGSDLVVESPDAQLAQVTLYDAAGHKLVTAQPYANAVIIDTADWPAKIYLVTIVLEDGSRSSLKIARKA